MQVDRPLFSHVHIHSLAGSISGSSAGCCDGGWLKPF
jgi:hypothetical protein